MTTFGDETSSLIHTDKRDRSYRKKNRKQYLTHFLEGMLSSDKNQDV